MIKKLLRAGSIGLATLCFGLASAGTATAASISYTGPGSTNIIRGASGGSSIYFTGPGSTSIISSGHNNYSNDMKRNDGNNYNHKDSDNKNYGNMYFNKHVDYKKPSYRTVSYVQHKVVKYDDNYRMKNKCWCPKSWSDWSWCADHMKNNKNWMGQCSCDKWHMAMNWNTKSWNNWWMENCHNRTASWQDSCKPVVARVAVYHKNDNKDYKKDYSNHDEHNNYDYKKSYDNDKHDYSMHHESDKKDYSSHDKYVKHDDSDKKQVYEHKDYSDKKDDVHHDSDNKDYGYSDSHKSDVRQENDNRVTINNTTHQTATTGDATVYGNTHGGSAVTGDAWNRNTTDANVEIDNSRVDSAKTYDNQNDWRSRNSTQVENNNNVTVNNSTYQTARSGDATVSHNTYGGDARTGDASNSNNTSVSVSINN